MHGLLPRRGRIEYRSIIAGSELNRCEGSLQVSALDLDLNDSCESQPPRQVFFGKREHQGARYIVQARLGLRNYRDRPTVYAPIIWLKRNRLIDELLRTWQIGATGPLRLQEQNTKRECERDTVPPAQWCMGAGGRDECASSSATGSSSLFASEVRYMAPDFVAQNREEEPVAIMACGIRGIRTRAKGD
ncbi:MAG: hypothetical protein HY000_37010 [Planctomycetes bacterium]|nr:hypothetical protein [Planctomycetota bacterium]